MRPRYRGPGPQEPSGFAAMLAITSDTASERSTALTPLETRSYVTAVALPRMTDGDPPLMVTHPAPAPGPTGVPVPAMVLIPMTENETWPAALVVPVTVLVGQFTPTVAVHSRVSVQPVKSRVTVSPTSGLLAASRSVIVVAMDGSGRPESPVAPPTRMKVGTIECVGSGVPARETAAMKIPTRTRMPRQILRLDMARTSCGPTVCAEPCEAVFELNRTVQSRVRGSRAAHLSGSGRWECAE